MHVLLTLALLAGGGSAKVGAPAPNFQLPDLAGKEVSLKNFRGKTVVLEWFNPDCPYVKASHTKGSLVDTAARHAKKGVVWLAINSGAKGKQGYGVERNREATKTWSLNHPVLIDESGKVGRTYGATRTPHVFVIDPKGTLVYAGAIDNSRDGAGEMPEGGTLINYVDQAVKDVQAGRAVKIPSTKAYGCSVKYSS